MRRSLGGCGLVYLRACASRSSPRANAWMPEIAAMTCPSGTISPVTQNSWPSNDSSTYTNTVSLSHTTSTRAGQRRVTLWTIRSAQPSAGTLLAAQAALGSELSFHRRHPSPTGRPLDCHLPEPKSCPLCRASTQILAWQSSTHVMQSVSQCCVTDTTSVDRRRHRSVRCRHG